MKPLSLILLLISLSANSSDLSAPQAAAENFFQYFNAKDIEPLNNASGRPFIFAAGGEFIRWNSYGEALDFEALKNQGGLTRASTRTNWFTKMI